MKCAVQNRRRNRNSNLPNFPQSQFTPGNFSTVGEFSTDDQIDNFRQQIYSIIHCGKPVTSLYEGTNPGKSRQNGPGNGNPSSGGSSTLVATSASIHEKPKTKQRPKTDTSMPAIRVSKPKATRSDPDDMLKFWQKHYSFYFPEFETEDDQSNSRKLGHNLANSNLFVNNMKSQGKCVVKNIPKLDASPKLKTSYYPSLEFERSFPRKEGSQLKGKQGNSNSAEIKIDLSAKCRMNNDGKNVLSYRAYDGWEIAIPFTPSPTLGDSIYPSKPNMANHLTKPQSSGTEFYSAGKFRKDKDHPVTKFEAFSPKLTSISPFGNGNSVSRSGLRGSAEFHDPAYAIDAVTRSNAAV